MKSLQTHQLGKSSLHQQFCFALLLFVSSYLYLLFNVVEPGQQHGAYLNDVGVGDTMKKKLGDGCYHIFLDVGANIGIHTRFLYERDRYPNAKIGHGIFSQEFGTTRDNRDFCSFGFEPNPTHATRHKRLEESYNHLGWRYHYIQGGVYDAAGVVKFYHKNDTEHEEWGFTMYPGGDPVTLPVVRLSTWIQDEIMGRKLPATVYGNYSSGPKVVMKMDIESYEFAVLPDLMFTGVLCKSVDFVFGEFHNWEIKYAADSKTGRGELHIPHGANGGEGIAIMSSTLKLLNSVKDCLTTLKEMDDESYLHDGVPLPSVR